MASSSLSRSTRPDGVGARRAESPEVHEAFAMHGFEPGKLRQRIGMVVDADVDQRIFLAVVR